MCTPSSEPCCWLPSSPTDGCPDVLVPSGARPSRTVGVLVHGFTVGKCWVLGPKGPLPPLLGSHDTLSWHWTLSRLAPVQNQLSVPTLA